MAPLSNPLPWLRNVARPGVILSLALSGLLAWWSIAAVLEKTGGVPAVPLDDTFIHFQFARRWAELRPYEYVAGAPPVPGATSMAWPLALAPFWLLGFREESLIWPAWAFGFVFLGLLAVETTRFGRGFLRPGPALAAGAMVLSFGGLVWCAGSGMEVLPFSWALMRSGRLASEWVEADDAARTRRRFVHLLVMAGLTPLLRPEGVVASIVVAGALARHPAFGKRWLALAPLALVLAGPLLQFLFTGHLRSTTTTVKWLLASPYQAHSWPRIRDNVMLLYSTLLDGRLWSSLFIPEGSRVVGALVLPALVYQCGRSERRLRGVAVTLIAAGIFLTTTYDTFLVNRLRYLWPFAPAWFLGLAALSEQLGDLAERVQTGARHLEVVVAGVIVGMFASMLPQTINDLAVSSDAIRQQQVAMAHWARRALPRDALIGVNDAGAISYLSRRRTFDLVGLTTASEARYWAAGPGSRWEHYEHLGAGQLPTHLIVYKNWIAAPTIFGEFLTERSVYGASILGAATKSAHLARWDALGSGAAPTLVPGGQLVDELDVSDLDAEAAHDFELFSASQYENLVYNDGQGRSVDGGRTNRTLDRFHLELAAGGRIVARVVSSGSGDLEVLVDGRPLGPVAVADGLWSEAEFRLPRDIAGGRHRVEVRRRRRRGTFAALHYWSFR